MSLPSYYPLTVYRGDTARWQIDVWQDDAGTVPVDLTGVTVAATVRQSATTALTCTVAANRITVVLTSSASAALAAGNGGHWDLQLTYASGDVTTILKGDVNVWADVTGAA